jgi:hypothetical protein
MHNPPSALRQCEPGKVDFLDQISKGSGFELGAAEPFFGPNDKDLVERLDREVVQGRVTMDLIQLAAEITTFLAPFFPYLVLGGEAALREIGKKSGEAAWDKAKFLWNKIQNPKLDGVAAVLAEHPTDEDFQTVLAKLLIEQLEASPDLAAELMSIIQDDDDVFQSILVEQGSKVRDIQQRLSRGGKQKTTIRGSQARNITQEQ